MRWTFVAVMLGFFALVAYCVRTWAENKRSKRILDLTVPKKEGTK